MKTLLKGGNVYRGGRFSVADILVDGETIESVGEGLPPEGATVIDAAGMHVVPGLIDVHVHLREPGFSYKETITSGTAAAARGGYTTVCSMPNVNPAPDSKENLAVQLRMIREGQIVKVVPYGTITVGQKGSGQLADFESMKEFVVGFSDDGRGVQSAALMKEAMFRAAKAGKPVVAHCEVDELLRGGYIHDGWYAREHGHRGICSESEWMQVERDIELARRTGCQYHVCHVSTKESVGLVRKAKADGLKVTCETAPHYLLLCEDDLREDGRFKMNPPLRSRMDRAALIAGIADGTIDVIATDHAPHSAQEKSKGLQGSAMGIVGLETSFGLLYRHLVGNNIITLERLLDMMSILPGRIFGLGGGITPGQAADIAMFDLDARWTVDPEEFVSMGRATPFTGWEARGRNMMTMVNGVVVYNNFRGVKNV